MALDKMEQELLEEFEKGNFSSVDNIKEFMQSARSSATSYQKKEQRINIRLSSSDLIRLKRKAAQEGIPYQTLTSSIIHKYVNEAL